MYHFSDPHRGEIVTFHCHGEIGGEITPDPPLTSAGNQQAIGLPSDTVVGRANHAYVDEKKADDIPTRPVHLGDKQYVLMGDNRSASYNSVCLALRPLTRNERL